MNTGTINHTALQDTVRLLVGDAGLAIASKVYDTVSIAEARGFADGVRAMTAEHQSDIEAAYDDGYDDGNETAYNDGYSDGYEEGVKDGVAIESLFPVGCAGKANARIEGADWDHPQMVDGYIVTELGANALAVANEAQPDDSGLASDHYDTWHQRFHRPGADE